MINIKRISFLIGLFSLLSACESDTGNQTRDLAIYDPMNPVYASGFKVVIEEGVRKVQIMNPWSPGRILQEKIILPDSMQSKNEGNTIELIQTPVNHVVALSATQWAGFEKLGALSHIAGITEAGFAQSPAMKKLVQNDEVVDVGRHGVLKPELLLQLQADVILYSPESTGIPTILSNTGLPLLAWPDYYETDPRGRAEWIKLIGILLQKEEEAKALFDGIIAVYNDHTALALSLDDKPKVLADKAFSGQWYIPGGKSYMASFFEHAGSSYLWADNKSTASVPLDMETILYKANQADYWRIAHASPQGYSLAMLAQENPMYADIKAFREGKVLFCNTFKSGYFEKGIYEPHLILADLIHFFHPGQLPNYTPVYHELLK
jgi:iron complex transport system substrate-binding protein